MNAVRRKIGESTVLAGCSEKEDEFLHEEGEGKGGNRLGFSAQEVGGRHYAQERGCATLLVRRTQKKKGPGLPSSKHTKKKKAIEPPGK